MRKAQFFQTSEADAVRLIVRAGLVRMATTTPEGEPVLRALHGVWVDGALAFHGATVGEKALAVGRPAVLSADETVASIPSWFLDAEMACPATTLYRAAQVHGVIERVDDGRQKAAVLEALMARFQPEGRYEPIDPDDPRYAKPVRSIGVYRVRPTRITGKAKLTQNRTPAERARVIAQLWRRGDAGDDAAIEAIREANAGAEVPAVLGGREGYTLHARLDARDEGAVADMLLEVGFYDGMTRDDAQAAQRCASAWVGARDATGAVVASARAVGDRVKRAWIYDVVVHPAHRRRGLARALMALLLEHAAVRGVREQWLHTFSAERLYASMGFAVVTRELTSNRVMMLRRPSGVGAPSAP
jgi:ribosomal protein S18 acetylase RimI-like enzyme/nitroimidazol reductase NimA-like FMN-containing flavoprotein (pyridoxamine 5'-phosphate oxidase superfamily)